MIDPVYYPIWNATYEVRDTETLRLLWLDLSRTNMEAAVELDNSECQLTCNPILFQIRHILYLMRVPPPPTCPS